MLAAANRVAAPGNPRRYACILLWWSRGYPTMPAAAAAAAAGLGAAPNMCLAAAGWIGWPGCCCWWWGWWWPR